MYQPVSIPPAWDTAKWTKHTMPARPSFKAMLVKHAIASGSTTPQIIHEKKLEENGKRVFIPLTKFAYHHAPLTQETIFLLYKILTENYSTEINYKIYYKQNPNALIREGDGKKIEFCPPAKVVQEMLRMVEIYRDIENVLNPELVAAWITHAILNIHPYQDMNGRVARFLCDVVLFRKQQYPVFCNGFDRKKYCQGLFACDHGNMQVFSNHFSEQQLKSRMEEFISKKPL